MIGVLCLVMVVVWMVVDIMVSMMALIGGALVIVKNSRKLELDVLGTTELRWAILIIRLCQDSDLRCKDQRFGRKR
jgi:hypothetical protein